MKVIESGERKARTEHMCDFCGGTITKSEIYFYQKIKGDELYTWKNHKKCGKLAAELNMEASDEGLTGEDFCEQVAEYLRGVRPHEQVDALVYILERRKAAKGEA